MLEADGEDRSRPGSRAIFLHRESLEHLESVSEGLGWEIAQHGIVWTTKKTYYGEDLVYERTYPPPDPTRLPHSTNLSQVVIEQLLLDACKRAGVELVWEQELVSSTTSPDGVVLRTAAGDEWHAPYVVGADGARSIVRSSARIELEGPRIPDSFVIVDVAEDEGSPMLPERVFYYEHPAVHGRNVLLVPFAGGIRADLQLRPDDDPEQFNDPEGVKGWIAQVLPPKYADRVAWVSTYRFYQVVASAFTDEHRRIALVGEAAHLFAPFGAPRPQLGHPRCDRRRTGDEGRHADCDRSLRNHPPRGRALQPRGLEPRAAPHAGERMEDPARTQGQSRNRQAWHRRRHVARLVTVRPSRRRAQDRDRLVLIEAAGVSGDGSSPMQPWS